MFHDYSLTGWKFLRRSRTLAYNTLASSICEKTNAGDVGSEVIRGGTVWLPKVPPDEAFKNRFSR